MTINVTFESIEEMKGFAAMMAGVGKESRQPVTARPESQNTASVQPATTPPVEIQAQPIQPAAQAAPPAANPVAGAMATVPTATATYALDDLARAAMTLMDSGKQAELQQLLAGYGVEALPMLPQSQYGAFATGLRGLGAQI